MLSNTPYSTDNKASKISDAHLKELKSIFPGAIKENVAFSEISRWRVGGLARVIAQPKNTQELASLRKWINDCELPSLIIGGTSNLLFSDEGVDAITIQLPSNSKELSITGTTVLVSASMWVPALVRQTMKAGLTGLEHACGIPGTLGGLICMNGGSQRKGIGEAINTVTSVKSDGTILQRTSSECEFSYRASIFQDNNEVVTQASLELEPAKSIKQSRSEILEILKSRRLKFPQKTPNCGSVFVSDPSMYAQYGPPGKVIEEIGLKGKRVGEAIISTQHANFILNTGGATAKDILKLIRDTRETVFHETGYMMKVEARYVKNNGEIVEI